MSSNFDKMEHELQSLSGNMEKIISGSTVIHSNLEGQRSQLNKLSSTHALLQKLHFMFELTPKMRAFMQDKSYNEAVKYYLQAETALERYRHFPSISAIDSECRQLLTELKEKLHQQFNESNDNTSGSSPGTGSSNIKMTETVHLLLLLREDSLVLAKKFLSFSQTRLENNRSELDYYIKESEKSQVGQITDDVHMDVLEFVDMACNGYLSNLSSIIATYQSLFLTQSMTKDKKPDLSEETDLLNNFVDQAVKNFLEKISKRISHEKPFTCDAKFLARALDRFYSRLSSLKKVFPSKDFSKEGRKLVIQVIHDQCVNSLEYLKSCFGDELIKVRQSMATADLESDRSGSTITTESDPMAISSLSDTVLAIEASISESTKMVLTYLVTLRQPDVFFTGPSSASHADLDFLRLIREEVVVSFLTHVIRCSEDYQRTGMSWSSPPQLVLILSKVCFDLEASLLSYLLSHVDDVLTARRSSSSSHRGLTPVSDLTFMAKATAQNLLNHYVRRCGLNISHLIRKSIENRDWMSCTEPRSVRSVVKRIVDDLSIIESQVGDLYEEGSRVERSSDSSRNRRAFSVGTSNSRANKSASSSSSLPWPSMQHHHNSAHNSIIDQSLMSNIQKLFSERIEVFTPVDFTRLSVLTGIIKISLKTLIECSRQSTFSRHGLQQMQVDSFYLQMFLWKFVSDENVMHSLLDEALTSAMNRCLDPVLIDVTIIEKICEGQ